VPLAQSLAAQHPGRVWENTHVGGHRYAANLVLLPPSTRGWFQVTGPLNKVRALTEIFHP
jgi:hypothetical protein